MMRFGEVIMRRADVLAVISADPDRLTRSYLTREHRQAAEQILAWMREAGMQAELDALGNAVGRYAGNDPDAPLVITGSHMDSVVDAGRYDGIFGILSAIACVDDLHRRGKRLPYALEVVAFGDEEGVRFGVTMTGSKALAGSFDADALECTDSDGVSLRNALREWGGDPEAIAALERDPIRVAAFVEAHIEQGPVLLNEGLPLGVVTSIAGSSRVRARVSGLAGHAGTVPMRERKDALAAASAMVLAIESHCLERSDRLVGTVGKLAIAGGGASNIIPGTVELSIDLRSGDDVTRLAALAAIEAKCRAIAASRGVTLDWDAFFHLDAAPCDPGLEARMADAIAAQGVPVRHLPSGAGHDAMQFARIAPIVMLFVRCGNGGISHNPLETMTAEDAELASSALLHFLENLSVIAS
jgi:hydantoinase/carbamoylase family amidase